MSMKNQKAYLYSFISPLMIVIAIIGLIFKNENQKIYYLPLIITGFYLILEKEFCRRLHKKNILQKIKFFKKKNK